jgi:uncharacterized protein
MKSFFPVLMGCLLFACVPASPSVAQSSSSSQTALQGGFPPAPAKYFNDYAGITSADTQSRLNMRLADFDRTTKNQVVVAIFPHRPEILPLATYCTDVANKWGVGYKGSNNGVVLFVFVADHQLRIATGNGMGAVLPDATCKAIIDQAIVPQFRKNNFDAGLSAGVDAMLKAISAGAPTTLTK